MTPLAAVQIAAFRPWSRRRCSGVACVALAIAGWFPFQTILAQGDEPDRPDSPTVTLRGIVKELGSGDPIAGAEVVIVSAKTPDAKPRVWELCDEDCLKHGRSDQAGQFTIENVHADRMIKLLVARKGYGSKTVADVDPRQKSLVVNLSPPELKTIADESNDLHGRVVDPDGNPVAGVIIAPLGYHQNRLPHYGSMDDVALPTITDEEGIFRIPSTKRSSLWGVSIRALGFCPHDNTLATGVDHTLRLFRGVTLRGRVVHAGRPRQGAVVGVRMAQPWSGIRPGIWEAVVDDDGHFAIANAPQRTPLLLYGKIDSLKHFGALPIRRLASTEMADLDLGDVEITAGHTLKGRVVVEDDQPLPPHLWVQISRGEIFDTTEMPLAEDGTFELKSLPDELLHFSVYALPPGQSKPQHFFGFHLSQKNRSLNPYLPLVLLGRVDTDLEIKVLLEPGDAEFPPLGPNDPEAAMRNGKYPLLQKKRLQGLPVD